MKIRPIVTAFLLILLCSPSLAQRTKYCNARFQFCMDYPKDFTGKGESANGDGQTFVSKDSKAIILAFGSLADDTDLEEDVLIHAFKTASSDYKVVYKVIRPDWFIFSGIDRSGKTVYRKTVKRSIGYSGGGATDVFQTIMITYPPAD